MTQRTKVIPIVLAIWLSIASAALAEEEPPAVADDPPATRSVSVLDYYKDGGWMMHVLTLCSIGTIAVAVYCFTQMNRKQMAPPQMLDSMTRYMEKMDVSHAYEVCQTTPSSFSNVLSSALLKFNSNRDKANKESMVEAAGETLDQEEMRYMLWVNYLNVFATLAPMIGLLGTVVGMIESFQQLEQKNAAPEDLAGGIRQAMVTTAGGLLVGIPSMFFYFFFRDRLTSIISGIQKHTSFLIDILSGEVKLERSTE